MKSTIVLMLISSIVALMALVACASGSENQTLQERATEASKHIDGSETGWRKTYKYINPEFRSQCTEDEFIEATMSLSAMFMGYGAEYKIEVISATESGNVGTVTSRIFNESYESENSDKWIKVDGTWWDASYDKDDNNLLSLGCQD